MNAALPRNRWRAQAWKGRRRVLIHTVCHFAADHHGGQWSRGCRLLCRALAAARRYGMHSPLDYRMTAEARRIYSHLAAEYGASL